MAKTKKQITLETDVIDLYRKWIKAKADETRAKADKEEASNSLKLLIPDDGQTVADITRKNTPGSSTSYTKVVAALTLLLPKTQQTKVPKIIEKFSKPTERVSFKGPEV